MNLNMVILRLKKLSIKPKSSSFWNISYIGRKQLTSK